MPKVDTLVSDIYRVLETPQKIPQEAVEALGREIAEAVAKSLGEGAAAPGTLRMSNLGTPCDRKLWYEVNRPSLKEKTPAHVRLKFLYGHILESLLLSLAELAGHDVRGRQDELYIGDVKGHRDAIIDGRTIDVKSATTNSFKKFKDNGLRQDDPFGYLDQINAYRYADKDNVDDKVSFLAVDKQLGHLTLDTYPANDTDYDELVIRKEEMLAQEKPPERAFADVAEGKSGNRKLDTNCAYCPFKQACWPNLRTFIYSNGPVYLTKVEREPNVLEVNGPREF